MNGNPDRGTGFVIQRVPGGGQKDLLRPSWEDSGAGVPADIEEKIFDRGFREIPGSGCS